MAAGGAQQLYGIKPDLTVMGKVIGGGLPAAALGQHRRQRPMNEKRIKDIKKRQKDDRGHGSEQ